MNGWGSCISPERYQLSGNQWEIIGRQLMKDEQEVVIVFIGFRIVIFDFKILSFFMNASVHFFYQLLQKSKAKSTELRS